MVRSLFLLLLVIFSLSCGGGGGSTSDNYSLYFKAKSSYGLNDGDIIVITEKDTGTILWNDSIENNPEVRVNLYVPVSLTLEIKRGSTNYISTYISKDQIRKSHRRVIQVGNLNAVTTLLSELDETDLSKYFDNVSDFTELSYANINSTGIRKKDTFYNILANRVNALTIYQDILYKTDASVIGNHQALYKSIINYDNKDIWREKAILIDNIPDKENGGVNLISDILSRNKIFKSNTYDIYTPDELRDILYNTGSVVDTLNYTGGDVVIVDNQYSVSDNLSLENLEVTGNIVLNGEILEPTINYYTLDNTITNNQYYTLDNTIQQYYTLDNTITNNHYYTLDNTITNNITQLTNTFTLDTFDSISGNTITSSNIYLSDNIYINGNALESVVNYYTLDNTITNNQYYTLDNTITNNITQLTNTITNNYSVTNFDSISGNTITSGNIYLSDNIYINGNALQSIVNNNTYTSVTNTITNTYSVTNFDSISGNTIVLGGNTLSYIDPTTLMSQTNGNISLGNVFAYSANLSSLVVDGNIISYIDPNSVVTSTGGTITSSTGVFDSLVLDGNTIGYIDPNSVVMSIGGNTTMGNVTINGNTIVGDSIEDTITISSNVIPSTGDLYVSGNVLSSDNIFTLGTANHPWSRIYVYDLVMVSDGNKKENIRTLEYGIDEIMELNPVSYTYKGKEENSLGLIAQDAEKIVPEIVSGNTNKGVSYIELIPILIKAIQEQQKEIEQLKKRLDKIW